MNMVFLERQQALTLTEYNDYNGVFSEYIDYDGVFSENID